MQRKLINIEEKIKNYKRKTIREKYLTINILHGEDKHIKIYLNNEEDEKFLLKSKKLFNS